MFSVPGFHAQFSPDGTTMLTLDGDGTLAVWDASNGAELAATETGTEAYLPEFSEDGTKIVSVELSTQVWDVGLTTSVEGDYLLGLSPDGSLVFMGGQEDDVVVVWDLATGDKLYELVGHSGGVNSLAFGPDESTVATASDDGTVMIWKLPDRT